MPIGFDAGDVAPERDKPARLGPDELMLRFQGVRLERVESAVVWTRWRTAADERVCPECGPLDGLAWPADEGPIPPLHNHCRCERGLAFLEWSSRTGAERRWRWRRMS